MPVAIGKVAPTGWVKNAVLARGLSVPLKNEGENENYYLENQICIVWVGNLNIHRMVTLPEPVGERQLGKGRVEWGPLWGGENS